MRLFRQKQAGDWGGTFAEIRAALEQHLGSRRAPTVEPLPIDRGDMIN
jgi:hypothetical protein